MHLPSTGPIVLLVFGPYHVAHNLQTEEPEDLDDRWVLFWIPLSLSLANLLAGSGPGMLGFLRSSQPRSSAPR